MFTCHDPIRDVEKERKLIYRNKRPKQTKKTPQTIFIDYHRCGINKLCNTGKRVRDWILSTSIDIAQGINDLKVIVH